MRHIPLILLTAAAAACSSNRAPVRGPDDPAAAGSPATSTFDGQVVGVDRADPQARLSSSVRLVLRSGSDRPITVELAPGWYLDEQGLSFAENDRLRIEGNRSVAADGKPRIIAWKVEKDRRVVPLRDQHGQPIWNHAGDNGK